MFLRLSFTVVGLTLLAGCTSEPAAVPPASEPPVTACEIVEAPPIEVPDADPPSEQANADEPTASETAPATPPVATDAPQATTNESAVDLVPHAAQIKQLLAKAMADFSREHPDEAASLLVVSYSGFSPLAMIAIDTPEHSAAFVEEFKDSAGRDEHGQFCDSPYDCAYQLAEYGFPGFPDVYQVEWPLHLKLPDGQVVAVDTTERGDEAMNEAMVNFLVPIVEQLVIDAKLKRAEVFRLGVVAQNSKYSKFWLAKPAAQ